MRQRATINRIDRLYKKQLVSTTITAGGSANETITLLDLGIAATQAVKPTLGLFHFGLTMASAPVYVVVQWVIEGVSTSRSLLITPGEITTVRLPVPRSTDFDDNPINTQVIQIRYDNSNPTTAATVSCVAEVNFLGMPSYN